MSRFVVAALLATSLFAVPASAFAASQPRAQHQFYSVVRLGNLGGIFSSATGINNRGWVTGWSDFPGDTSDRAILWSHGRTINLGFLGGNNSSVDWPVKNDRGDIPGNSSTSAIDPLGENFCYNNAPYLCGGFLWRNGVLTPLPTLGGYNSSASGENNHGQVVGWAENSTADPTCIAPQVLDWEAVIYWPESRRLQELPPFAGDTVAGATGINDRGQVVGGSGVCGPVVGSVLMHAVLWENGKVVDLGSLGGKVSNIATAINNRGQIVGVSDLPGDTAQHATLWQDGRMFDLGTLPRDASSAAISINNQGQIVGISCDANGNCRAVLWQDGVIVDLNSLIAPRSRLFLTVGNDINDRGEIVGEAFDTVTGSAPAFVAVPHHSAAIPGAGKPSSTIILPERVRRQLQQRLHGFGHFGGGGAG